MKPVRIFRHVDCEGPGYLLNILQQHDIPHELIAIDRQDIIPADIDNISGLIFMGGGMSVNDAYPWIKQELELIQKAHQSALPVLGICLGSQLICRAMGGVVTPGKHREVGWASVYKLPNNSSDDWFNDLPDSFVAFHWHGETFSIPQGATRLLRSDCYENQAFAIGNTLALQFHLEMQADMVREWLERFYAEINDAGPCVESETAILEQLELKISRLNKLADHIFTRWLKKLDLS